MFNKFFYYLWSIRAQLVNYFITGATGTVLDLGTLYLFKNYWHWRPYIAAIVNQLIVLVYIFLLNKYWTFKTQGQTRRQIVRFSEIYIYNYAFAVVWMWFLNEKNSFNYLGVRLINIILSISWNFLLYKFWVYRGALVDNSPNTPLTN